MSQARGVSALETVASPSSSTGPPGEGQSLGFEGISANVKLLLKLIQDHNGGVTKDNVERKHHRVAGMISIIDEVKNRIQKIQSASKRRVELRRCNTDVKTNLPSPRGKSAPDLTDEKERLRRELHASLIARQSIQAMCSSLGKEKQIMAAELARKAQELTEMEEYINDLKEQNHMLMEKLQASSLKQKEKSNEVDLQANLALQEQNKELSEQLIQSIEVYRSLKRKLQLAQEENMEMHAKMEGMEADIQAGINKIHGFKEKMATTTTTNGEADIIIKEEISALEQTFKSLSLKVSQHR